MQAEWEDPQPLEGETAKQRLDRNFSELLQELRVTQTGVQILLGFLLTMVFTAGFAAVDGWQLGLYVAALALTTLAFGLLVAPVALHRGLFRRGLKPDLVRMTHILTFLGLLALLLAVSTAVTLALVVALGVTPGIVGGVATLVVLASIWYVLPLVVRLQHRGDHLR